jgi:hypothetical protein
MSIPIQYLFSASDNTEGEGANAYFGHDIIAYTGQSFGFHKLFFPSTQKPTEAQYSLGHISRIFVGNS